MNWLQFARLIRQIYGRGSPDIEWIQKLGLLAVKIGQIHALRIDFLDPGKCRELARLYRHTASIPREDFDRLLDEYLSDEQRSRFAHIDDEPIAAASVGQVHRARLTSGADVAVKVVKSRQRESFLRDVSSVRRLLRLVIRFYPKLKQVGDPLGILRDVEEYTLSELDLRNEVAGQKALRRVYEDNKSRFDLSGLAFPEIHEDLCNENVMVSEYIPGRTFDEMLDAGDLEYQLLLDLFHVHGFYMFGAGEFHGDVHPGNVMFSDGRLYFVDTGYIGRVGPKIRTGLFQFFKALSAYDYPECARALNGMSQVEIAGPAYGHYEKKFIQLYSDFTNSTVSDVSLTKKMMHTIKLGVHSGMSFEKGIFAIIRSLMYLDGMVLKCNPDAVLVRDMRRFIDEFEKVV